jgi:hypothetical protein
MTHDSTDTLLDHSALAGRTVYVRRGPRWETYVVRAGGGLRPGQSGVPQVHHWRLSTAS